MTITKLKPKPPKTLRELLNYYNSVIKSLQKVADECMRGAIEWRSQKNEYKDRMEKIAQCENNLKSKK